MRLIFGLPGTQSTDLRCSTVTMARREGRSLFQADSETHTWDEERFDRLLRLAAVLQGSLPGFAQASGTNSRARQDRISCVRVVPASRSHHGRALDDWLSAEHEVLANYGANDPRLRVVLAFGLLKGL